MSGKFSGAPPPGQINQGDAQPEISLSVLMLMTLLAPGLVSKKPSSISGVTKYPYLILAHKALNVLLLHIGIEIINGTLASGLKYSIVSCFEEKSSIACDLPSVPGYFIFAWKLVRDIASGVQQAPMHPRGPAGLPEDLLPAYVEPPQRISVACLRDLLQLTEHFDIVETQSPAGPLERAGGPSPAYGDFVRHGPWHDALVSKKS